MKGLNAVDERKYKINIIKEILDKAFSEYVNVSKKKLIAVMAIDQGMAETKVIEYLKILKEVMNFQEEGDKIFKTIEHEQKDISEGSTEGIQTNL